MSKIEFKNVCYYFNKNKDIAKPISFVASDYIDKKGDTISPYIGIVGSANCAKSSLLKCLCGKKDIIAGNIYIDGKDVLKDDGINDIFYVLKNDLTRKDYSVFEYLYFSFLDLDGEVFYSRLTYALDYFSLSSYIDSPIDFLPEEKIADLYAVRAVIAAKKTVVFDDIFKNNKTVNDKFLNDLRILNRVFNKNIIYVSRDGKEFIDNASYIVFLQNGVVYQKGIPESFRKYPKDLHVLEYFSNEKLNLISTVSNKEDDKYYLDIKAFNKNHILCPMVLQNSLSYINNKEFLLCLPSKSVRLSNDKERSIYAQVISCQKIIDDNYFTVCRTIKCEVSQEISLFTDDFIPLNTIVNLDIKLEEVYFFDNKTKKNIDLLYIKENRYESFIKDNKISIFGRMVNLPRQFYTGDISSCSLIIPNEAVLISSGDFIGKVIYKAKFDDTYKYILSLDNKTITIETKDDFKLDDEISFKIDFMRVKIKINDDTQIEFDHFTNSFLAQIERVSIYSINDKNLLEERVQLVKNINKNFDTKISNLLLEQNNFLSNYLSSMQRKLYSNTKKGFKSTLKLLKEELNSFVVKNLMSKSKRYNIVKRKMNYRKIILLKIFRKNKNSILDNIRHLKKNFMQKQNERIDNINKRRYQETNVYDYAYYLKINKAKFLLSSKYNEVLAKYFDSKNNIFEFHLPIENFKETQEENNIALKVENTCEFNDINVIRFRYEDLLNNQSHLYMLSDKKYNCGKVLKIDLDVNDLDIYLPDIKVKIY